MLMPRRAIAAACIGNLLEWYDFTVYALFAPYIGNSFFPSNDPGAALVKTFLIFGAGFVVRPLGAMLIGAYGDRAGRKAALMLTIWIMAAGTLLIAITPGYAVIGVFAPCLLLVGRLLQAQVLTQLEDGSYIVGVNDAALRMSLPEGTTVGSQLQLTWGIASCGPVVVCVSVNSTISPPSSRFPVVHRRGSSLSASSLNSGI